MEDFLGKALTDAYPYIGGFLSGAVLVLIACIGAFIFYYDRIENFILKIFGYIASLHRVLDKKYIERSLESELNRFSRQLADNIVGHNATKLDIEFVDTEDDVNAFLREGVFFVKTKRTTNKNENLVHIAMAFTSQTLLPTTSSYLSKKQNLATNLFATKKVLMQKSDQDVISKFVEDYLHPKTTEDEKVSELYGKLEHMDRAGIFFPVYLQELTFLGQRVFGDLRKREVQEEVSKMIEFLDNHSQRTQGSEEENCFRGSYCKFAIMLIGKGQKIDQYGVGTETYRNYLESLMSEGYENIYILGHEHRQDFINQVCPDSFLESKDFYMHKNESYNSVLHLEGGKEIKAKTYLMLIRQNNIDPYIPKN